ncbi:hypothetical protein YA38_04660 [Klebsiella aerogenes]|nr:hypothetical protein YA38_04660 [Klebsiella aerogenes]
MLSRLQIDLLPKNQPKNTHPTVLISIIYGFYRVFNYQLFFNLEQITGKYIYKIFLKIERDTKSEC